MNALRTIRAELLALFVDDGRLAGLILAWVVLCALLLRHLPASAGALALFAGLAALLIESATRRARPLRDRGPPST